MADYSSDIDEDSDTGDLNPIHSPSTTSTTSTTSTPKRGKKSAAKPVKGRGVEKKNKKKKNDTIGLAGSRRGFRRMVNEVVRKVGRHNTAFRWDAKGLLE